MQNKQRNTILLSCGILLVVACLCLGLILASGVGVSLLWPFEFPEDNEASLPTEENDNPIAGEDVDPEEMDTSPDPEPDDIEDTVVELPDDLAKKLLRIEGEVIQIRGLDQTSPVEKQLISESVLADIVKDDFFSEYDDEEAKQDVLVLEALGLLPGGFDLKGFYLDLYSEQIAGFYDSEIDEIYVVQGEKFGGSEKLTYSHEFTHVLQDQVYDLENGLGMNEEACEADTERCAAIQALIEGDASYTEVLWFQEYATRKDYLDVMKVFDEMESPILDTAPPYMASDLYFPYEYGYAFVQYLYEQEGYKTVDQAYLDPPVSTEQILHPEKYPDDIPQAVPLPDFSEVLGSGWILYDENVMGEWFTFLILNQAFEETYRLSEGIASDAAQGWGGDTYVVYINEDTDELVFVMETVWDTIDDADEFAEAFEDYATSRWGDSTGEMEGHPTWHGENGTILFERAIDHTMWIIAPDDAVLKSVLSEFK